jgi:pSer/pThr/pTyr-binding forkhead associated (FHA) protein
MPLLAQLVDDVVVNKIELKQGTMTIGRHPDSDIQIDDTTISSRHARINVAASDYIENAVDVTVEDLGSTNGTFVNEEAISTRRLLVTNDIVRVGWNKFKFIDENQVDLEGTAHILQL